VTETSAPVLSGAGNTVTYTQGGAVVVASPAIAVADPGSLDLASASVKISSGLFTGDVLGANTAGTVITASYSAGVLSLTGSDTVAHYTQVLDSVTFHSTSANPTYYGTDTSRGLTWQVNDGTHASNTVTSTVTVVGVDQAPVLAGAGNTVTYTQGGAPVIASPKITVSDADSLRLVSASVTISSGFLAGDTLSVLTAPGFTARYNASTGVLTITGNVPRAAYQSTLDSVKFSSTSTNPTNSGTDTSRTLSWVVNDGTLTSNTVTSTVTVVGTGTASIAMVRTAAPSVSASTAAPAPAPAPEAQSKRPIFANATLSMGSASAAAGTSAIVPVRISNARGLQSMQLIIRYDDRALTPLAVERGALTARFTYNVAIVEPGVLRIDAAGRKPLATGSGDLFGVKFAVAPTATGRLSIDFVSASLNAARLTVRDPYEGAIVVKPQDPGTAAPKAGIPDLALNQSARSFDLGAGKTHAWLDDFLKPTTGKNGKTNSWTVVVKPRTLH